MFDCHKVSFAPICLAGEIYFFTAEPAGVIPLDKDLDEAATGRASTNGIFDSKPAVKAAATASLKSRQYGATLRRVVLFARVVAKRIKSTPFLIAPDSSDATPSDLHYLDRESVDDDEPIPLGKDARYCLKRESAPSKRYTLLQLIL